MIPEWWSSKLLLKFYTASVLGQGWEPKPLTRWQRFRNRVREIVRAPFFTYCPSCSHEHRRFF
jgi:hypothetical protein